MRLYPAASCGYSRVMPLSPSPSDWTPRAREWIAGQIPHADVRIEVIRERHWGSIWAVRAGERAWWFKRGHPALHGEVPLRRVLERYASPFVLAVVADDAARGWMLTEDQGATLHRLAEADPTSSLQMRIDVGRAIARVQRSVPLAEVRRLELDEFSPDQAVETLNTALAWFAALPSQHPAHVDEAGRREALAGMAEVVRQWDRLGQDAAVPTLAIDHNDLHLGNVFPGPLISDWGDAVLGHPFGTMRHLVVTTNRLHGRDAAQRVRDAYLTEWGHPADLAARFDLAIKLQVPNRLNCWWRLDSPDMVAEYAEYIRPLIEQVGRGWDRVTEP